MPMIELLLNILYSIIGAFLLGGICFLGATRLSRVLRVKADKEQAVSVQNQGNCNNLYYLEVKSPEPLLKFTLLQNKTPLAAVYLPEEPDGSDQSQAEDNQKSGNGQPVNGVASKASAAENSLNHSGQAVSSAAGKAASLLEQIGNFLPGSLGKALKEHSATARGVQVKALRISRAPQKMKRQVTGFRRGTKSKPGAPSGQLEVGPAEGSYFVQTPVVKPGESLHLSLRVGSNRRRYPQGSFPYTIEALPVPEGFPDQAAATEVQAGTITFNPVGSWRYLLPAFITILLVLVALIALVFLFRFIWL